MIGVKGKFIRLVERVGHEMIDASYISCVTTKFLKSFVQRAEQI